LRIVDAGNFLNTAVLDGNGRRLVQVKNMDKVMIG
jgi:hypothetical protein